MLLTNKTTLSQFLIEQNTFEESQKQDLNGLILDIALACKIISRLIASGADKDLGKDIGGDTNIQGEVQKPLDIISNEIFIDRTQWNGHLAGLASEELESFYPIPEPYIRGKYLLIFDPLDGSSNIDVNVSIGSIFSVLHAPQNSEPLKVEDFYQTGRQQIIAGYAIYGPSTFLVLTLGDGVYSFILDPRIGEFILQKSNIQIPKATKEFAINTSNARHWEQAVKDYYKDALAGKEGPREKDFNMRWIASLVAETHRILQRGGVFLYPRDFKDPSKAGRLRLLYEANPIGFIVEQAGGKVSTGYEQILDIKPTGVHQRVPLIFGSYDEVETIEKYHKNQN